MFLNIKIGTTGSAQYRKIVVNFTENCPFPLTSAQVMDDDKEESDIESESDDEEDGFEMTALESYKTAIDSDDTNDDEYILFKELLENIQQNDPNWYSILMSPLNGQQQKAIQEVFTLALQRKAARGLSTDCLSFK